MTAVSRMDAGHRWPLSRRAANLRLSAIRELYKYAQQPGVISFAGGQPAPELVWPEAIAQASRRILSDQPAASLLYGPSEGWPSLRARIAAMYSGNGVSVSPEHVIITTGSQQGLDLVGKVLIETGQALLIEDPAYVGALQAFALYEPDYVAIRDVATVLAAPDRYVASLAYLQPSFQNPTGRSYTEAERERLANVLPSRGTLIVEDDPYRELWFEKPAVSLHAHAPEAVVYLGSFSKVFAPALRIGYLIAPPTLLKAFVGEAGG